MKTLVLLSGGLDSSVNLGLAVDRGHEVEAVTFEYGQKAARKEIQVSHDLCKHFSVPHQVVNLDIFRQFTGSSLLSHVGIPQGDEVSIDNLEQSQKTAESVWVPNRNGIFINVAAGIAEHKKIEMLLVGFNLEEAATFPDNSQEFLSAMNKSLQFSTQKRVQVESFTTQLHKTEIVRKGIEIQFPFIKIWPCYLDGEIWCRKCESCLRSLRAFKAAGLGEL